MKKFLTIVLFFLFTLGACRMAYPADSLEVMDLKIQLWTEMIKHLETQQNWIRSDLKELVKKYKEAKKKYDKEQKEEAPL